MNNVIHVIDKIIKHKYMFKINAIQLIGRLYSLFLLLIEALFR